jgi:hypothetical protein
MKHDAIIILYPSVQSVVGEGNSSIAYDANGDVVSWDIDAVATKEAELLAAFKLGELREERNFLLAKTDHWVLSDTADATSAQITYRQALRDITDNATSLDDVTWPEKP